MRWLLHKHPIALAVVLFIVVMAGIKFGAKALIEEYGLWFWLPAMIGIFAVGFWIERRDRQREPDDNAG